MPPATISIQPLNRYRYFCSCASIQGIFYVGCSTGGCSLLADTKRFGKICQWHILWLPSIHPLSLYCPYVNMCVACMQCSGIHNATEIFPVQANLTVTSPYLWWPRGLGSQSLYTLQVYCWCYDADAFRGTWNVGIAPVVFGTSVAFHSTPV